MTNDLIALAVAGIAIWLIGVNGAIIYRFWPEGWLTTKLIAVSFLLGYVALSVVIGTPILWVIGVGLGVITLDAVAVAGIWRALYNARGSDDGVLIAYQRR